MTGIVCYLFFSRCFLSHSIGDIVMENLQVKEKQAKKATKTNIINKSSNESFLRDLETEKFCTFSTLAWLESMEIALASSVNRHGGWLAFLYIRSLNVHQTQIFDALNLSCMVF